MLCSRSTTRSRYSRKSTSSNRIWLDADAVSHDRNPKCQTHTSISHHIVVDIVVVGRSKMYSVFMTSPMVHQPIQLIYNLHFFFGGEHIFIHFPNFCVDTPVHFDSPNQHQHWQLNPEKIKFLRDSIRSRGIFSIVWKVPIKTGKKTSKLCSRETIAFVKRKIRTKKT